MVVLKLSPVYREVTQPSSEEILVCGVLDESALKRRVSEVLVDGESLLILLRVGVNLGHL